METRKMQGKSEKPDIRERLLQGALRLFTQKGYAMTTVREIVAETGVTKPVLYYYFESKEGIYRVLMQRLFEELESLFDALPEAEKPVREQLFKLADRTYEITVKNRDALRLMHAIYYGPPQGAPFFDFDAYYLHYYEHVRQIVRRGIKSGELGPGADEDITWTLMAAAQITIEEQICDRPALIDRDGLKRILEILFRGIGRKNEKKKR